MRPGFLCFRFFFKVSGVCGFSFSAGYNLHVSDPNYLAIVHCIVNHDHSLPSTTIIYHRVIDNA